MTGELTVTPEFVWLLPAHTDKPKPIEACWISQSLLPKGRLRNPGAQTVWSALCLISDSEIMTAAGWTACGTPVEP